MSERAPTETTNLDRYGYDVLPWDRPRALLFTKLEAPDPGASHFLGTVRPDGRPHAAAVGAIAHDGDLYFTSSPDARKAKNLASNPTCTISVSLKGIDVSLEGTAERVTDPETLDTVVAIYREGGWPAEVDEAAQAFTAPYSAPSAGPPPWHLYRFTFHTVFGVATEEPHGATRWRFDR